MHAQTLTGCHHDTLLYTKTIAQISMRQKLCVICITCPGHHCLGIPIFHTFFNSQILKLVAAIYFNSNLKHNNTIGLNCPDLGGTVPIFTALSRPSPCLSRFLGRTCTVVKKTKRFAAEHRIMDNWTLVLGNF